MLITEVQIVTVSVTMSIVSFCPQSLVLLPKLPDSLLQVLNGLLEHLVLGLYLADSLVLGAQLSAML